MTFNLEQDITTRNMSRFSCVRLINRVRVILLLTVSQSDLASSTCFGLITMFLLYNRSFGFVCSSPGSCWEFFSSSPRPDRFRGPPMGTRGSFSGVKWPGREVDHSSPSSAEVKNAWSYKSTPPIRLHGVVLS
jgi:hypothetical protein